MTLQIKRWHLVRRATTLTDIPSGVTGKRALACHTIRMQTNCDVRRKFKLTHWYLIFFNGMIL